ncbi:hypothetical protein MKZ38_000061 [Zalerion maritima]|uniref:Siroheme synthase n=1 Tax=Zalerion maritima TaxID=339359 RepID=A0AAD5RF85_9PEZI|nr:hypothetical protein MKZ38_000061 [Zalerion maritima]
MPRPRKRGGGLSKATAQNSKAEEEEVTQRPRAAAARGSASPAQSPSPAPEFNLPTNPPPRFFDTSFTTHRISPLYTGNSPLDHTRLEAIALRLRDALVGDVVRGVHLANSSDISWLSRHGPLERVEIDWVGVEDMLRVLGDDDSDLGGNSNHDTRKGLHLSLKYERASYAAILLPALYADVEEAGGSGPEAMDWTSMGPLASAGKKAREKLDGQPAPKFLNLPLLLLRMPGPLKITIFGFLQTVFDVRVSPLRMGTRTLVRLLESWIRESGANEETGKMGSKDVVMTLGFGLPRNDPVSTDGDEMEGIEYECGEQNKHETSEPAKPGLRTLDIFVPAKELPRWCGLGQDPVTKRVSHWTGDSISRQKLADGKEEEGWGWRASTNSGKPHFTEALAVYLDENLALDLFHPLVRVTKIACGGFVLTEERLKVFTPPASRPGPSRDGSGESELDVPDGVYRPVWSFMAELTQHACGKKIESGLFRKP